MMRVIVKRIVIATLAPYSVAFVLLYALGCWAATLPVVSPVSLALAFDTVGERLSFAAQSSLWMLLLVSPFLFLRSRRRHNKTKRPN